MVAARPHKLDVILAGIIIKAMTSRPKNEQGRLHFWQHLHYLFIHLLINKFIEIGKMMELLRTELSKPEIDREMVKKNRDMLMWLLLQYISGAVGKIGDQKFEDFLPVIGLFNELYGDESDLPVPDQNHPEFVTATGALCIFMHLRKAASRASSLKSLSLPTCLESQCEVLKKCTSSPVVNEMGIDDYRLPLLINVFFPAQQGQSQDYQLPLTRIIDCLTGEGHGKNASKIEDENNNENPRINSSSNPH